MQKKSKKKNGMKDIHTVVTMKIIKTEKKNGGRPNFTHNSNPNL